MIKNNIKSKGLQEKRRRELIGAAKKVIGEKGINSFKVKDITDLMDIGRGTLYEYIKTKNDIIYLVIEDAILKSIRHIEKPDRKARNPVEKLKWAIHSHLETTSANPKVLWAMFQESTPLTRWQFKRIHQLLDRYNGIFREILEQGGKEGVFRVEDPYLTAHGITTILNTWVIKKSLLSGRFSLPDYERKLSRIILQGCLNLEENRDGNLWKLGMALAEGEEERVKKTLDRRGRESTGEEARARRLE